MAKVELEKQQFLIEEENRRQEEQQGLEFFGNIFQGVLGLGAQNKKEKELRRQQKNH